MPKKSRRSSASKGSKDATDSLQTPPPELGEDGIAIAYDSGETYSHEDASQSDELEVDLTDFTLPNTEAEQSDNPKRNRESSSASRSAASKASFTTVVDISHVAHQGHPPPAAAGQVDSGSGAGCQDQVRSGAALGEDHGQPPSQREDAGAVLGIADHQPLLQSDGNLSIPALAQDREWLRSQLGRLEAITSNDLRLVLETRQQQPSQRGELPLAHEREAGTDNKPSPAQRHRGQSNGRQRSLGHDDSEVRNDQEKHGSSRDGQRPRDARAQNRSRSRGDRQRPRQESTGASSVSEDAVTTDERGDTPTKEEKDKSGQHHGSAKTSTRRERTRSPQTRSTYAEVVSQKREPSTAASTTPTPAFACSLEARFGGGPTPVLREKIQALSLMTYICYEEGRNLSNPIPAGSRTLLLPPEVTPELLLSMLAPSNVQFGLAMGYLTHDMTQRPADSELYKYRVVVTHKVGSEPPRDFLVTSLTPKEQFSFPPQAMSVMKYYHSSQPSCNWERVNRRADYQPNPGFNIASVEATLIVRVIKEPTTADTTADAVSRASTLARYPRRWQGLNGWDVFRRMVWDEDNQVHSRACHPCLRPLRPVRSNDTGGKPANSPPSKGKGSKR